MPGPAYWNFVWRRLATIGIFTVPFLAAAALDENGQLMGGLAVVGNDGAAEAGENPAFLAFGSKQRPQSLAARISAARAYNVSVTSLGTNYAGRYAINGDLSWARRAVFHNRFAVGIMASDIQTPAFQQYRVNGSSYNSSLGKDINLGLQQPARSFGGAVGLAWRLGDRESIGLRLRYSGAFITEKTNITINNSSTTSTETEKITDKYTHSLHAAFSYLYSTDMVDMTVQVANLGFQFQKTGQSYSASQSTSGTITTKYDATEYLNRTFTDPYVAFGYALKPWNRIRIFGEFGLQPPLQHSGYRNDYREKNPQGMTLETYTQDLDGAYFVGQGIALEITNALTAHLGARAIFGNAKTSYFSSDNLSRLVEATETTYFAAATGVSWRRGFQVLQVGIQYSYQRAALNKQETIFASGKDSLSTSDFAITFNNLGGYLGYSRDLP